MWKERAKDQQYERPYQIELLLQGQRPQMRKTANPLIVHHNVKIGQKGRVPEPRFTIFLDAAQRADDKQDANHGKQPTNPAGVEPRNDLRKVPKPPAVLIL